MVSLHKTSLFDTINIVLAKNRDPKQETSTTEISILLDLGMFYFMNTAKFSLHLQTSLIVFAN